MVELLVVESISSGGYVNLFFCFSGTLISGSYIQEQKDLEKMKADVRELKLC